MDTPLPKSRNSKTLAGGYQTSAEDASDEELDASRNNPNPDDSPEGTPAGLDAGVACAEVVPSFPEEGRASFDDPRSEVQVRGSKIFRADGTMSLISKKNLQIQDAAGKVRTVIFFSLYATLSNVGALANINLRRSSFKRFSHGGVVYVHHTHYSDITPLCTPNHTTRAAFYIEETDPYLNATFDTSYFINKSYLQAVIPLVEAELRKLLPRAEGTSYMGVGALRAEAAARVVLARDRVGGVVSR